MRPEFTKFFFKTHMADGQDKLTYVDNTNDYFYRHLQIDYVEM